MQCDLCGKDSNLYRTTIEGTEMSVCGGCSKHGRVIAKVKAMPIGTKKVQTFDAVETVQRIVKDYPNVVKLAREEKGLEQKELGQILAERESVVSRVESGSMKPSLRLARKFEKALGVNLVVSEKLGDVKLDKVTLSGGMTIGDLLKK